MDSKSAEILGKLKKYLERGEQIEEFPRKDVIDMIKAEYTEWMTERLHQIEECLSLYNVLMKLCIDMRDYIKLAGILDELIFDLHRTPIETLDRLDGLIKAKENMEEEFFIQNAKAVYERYPYQSTLGRIAFQGRGAIYTVITGNYDVLREPKYVDSSFDYICFTDNRQLHSRVWDIRYLDNPEKLDNVRLSRKPKILCHKFLEEYDYSIYIDGKLEIVGNFKEYIEKYSKGNSMLCFPHPSRECAYQEGVACIERNKDSDIVIKKQMNGYMQEGFPFNNGLIEGACLVRKHDDEILQRVMECWWREVRDKSRRDQLSIGYACWKNDFHYDLCDLYLSKNIYVHEQSHLV